MEASQNELLKQPQTTTNRVGEFLETYYQRFIDNYRLITIITLLWIRLRSNGHDEVVERSRVVTIWDDIPAIPGGEIATGSSNSR